MGRRREGSCRGPILTLRMTGHDGVRPFDPMVGIAAPARRLGFRPRPGSAIPFSGNADEVRRERPIFDAPGLDANTADRSDETGPAWLNPHVPANAMLEYQSAYGVFLIRWRLKSLAPSVHHAGPRSPRPSFGRLNFAPRRDQALRILCATSRFDFPPRVHQVAHEHGMKLRGEVGVGCPPKTGPDEEVAAIGGKR